MKLSDFLTDRGIAVAEFAGRIGVSEVKTVYRYLSGERKPAADVIRRIWIETDGAVGPADFHDLPNVRTNSRDCAVTDGTPVNGDAA